MKNYKGYEKKPYCDPHYPKTVASVVADTPEMRRLQENSKFQSQVKYHADYERMKGQKIDIVDDPEMTRHRQNTKVQSNVQYHGEIEKKKQQEAQRPSEEVVNNPPTSTSSYPTSSYNLDQYSNMQSEASYNPEAATPSSQSGTLIYSTEKGGKVNTTSKNVGSIADYDPLNGNWGSINSSKTAEKIEATLISGGPKKTKTSTKKKDKNEDDSESSVSTAAPTHAMPLSPSAASKSAIKEEKSTGFTVRALYDYNAADKDEVSFVEGDVIVNCQKVDEGWMTGTVQRTLTWGMLPANYVEKIVQPTGRFKLH
uniref:SH3 domain-containing protein n=1 Tax=Panagrolaimus superbus TaxID=310955 RepID=A0A914YJ37_9BILA